MADFLQPGLELLVKVGESSLSNTNFGQFWHKTKRNFTSLQTIQITKSMTSMVSILKDPARTLEPAWGDVKTAVQKLFDFLNKKMLNFYEKQPPSLSTFLHLP